MTENSGDPVEFLHQRIIEGWTDDERHDLWYFLAGLDPEAFDACHAHIMRMRKLRAEIRAERIDATGRCARCGQQIEHVAGVPGSDGMTPYWRHLDGATQPAPHAALPENDRIIPAGFTEGLGLRV